eukprot:9165154-Alexandrium_andersonii.AAC.2
MRAGTQSSGTKLQWMTTAQPPVMMHAQGGIVGMDEPWLRAVARPRLLSSCRGQSRVVSKLWGGG